MIWLPVPLPHENLATYDPPSWLLACPDLHLRTDAGRRFARAKANPDWSANPRAMACAILAIMALTAGALAPGLSADAFHGREGAESVAVADPVRELPEPAAFDPCWFVRCLDI